MDTLITLLIIYAFLCITMSSLFVAGMLKYGKIDTSLRSCFMLFIGLLIIWPIAVYIWIQEVRAGERP